MNADYAAFAYAPDYAVFSIPSMSVVDIAMPMPVAAATGVGKGIGAFSGLTGYMSLGLGAKVKPTIAPVGEGEVLVVKDSEYYFFLFSF